MFRGLRIAVAAASIFAVAGCYGFDYNEAKTQQAKGSAFDQALFKGYLAESKSEYDQGNYQSSDKWANNATLAAKGQTPKPTQVSDWRLPSAVVPEMTTARQRLQTAIDRGGANVAPNELAAAQVGWDCWAEQQRVEENFQPDDIAYCRNKFNDNIAKVEAALAPKPEVKKETPAAPKDFMVFFDWDKYNVTPEARKILADVASRVKSTGVKAVKVVGHTDTSGSPSYNLKLSIRRAEAIKAELVKLGVAADSITVSGVGQEDLLVPTKDGVREAQNRRAAISFPKAGASLDQKDGQVLVQIGTVN